MKTKHTTNRKIYIRTAVLVLAIFAGSMLLFSHTAHAATDTNPSGDFQKILTNIASFMSIILTFLQRLIWPILVMIGGLLNNDLIFNSPMENMMLQIWTQMRNFVNIMLVLVLVGVALYNVVAGEQQDYHLKAFLPKFIIALIAINFSFVGIKIVLDISNVLSQTIFALPDTVAAATGQSFLNDGVKSITNKASEFCPSYYGNQSDQTYNDNIDKAGQSAMCEKIANPSGSTGTSTKTNTGSSNTPAAYDPCSKASLAAATIPDDKYKFSALGNSMFTNYNANNAAIVMAVNFMQVAKQQYVNPCDVYNSIKSLAINTIFSVVMTIVYSTAFIVLLIVLLTRMAVVWVVACLSPLQFFFKFLPEPLKKMVSVGNIEEDFIAYAFMPIPIGIYMTIGYLMISVFQNVSGSGPSFLASISAMGLDVSGIGTVQQFMAAIIAVIVIWKGVFAAASAGEFSKSFVEGVKGAVEGAGSFATKSITFAPILPVTKSDGTPGKLSLAALGGIGSELDKKLKLMNNFEGQQETLRDITGTNQAAKYYKGISGSRTENEFKQNLANMNSNASATDKYSLQMQKAIADGIKNSHVKLVIPNEGLVDATGKTHTKAELEKNDNELLLQLLREGKFDQRGLDKIITENTKGFYGKAEAANDNDTNQLTGKAKDADTAVKKMESEGKDKYLTAAEKDDVKKFKDAKPEEKEKMSAKAADAAKKAEERAKAAEDAVKSIDALDKNKLTATTLDAALKNLEEKTKSISDPAKQAELRKGALDKLEEKVKDKPDLLKKVQEAKSRMVGGPSPELRGAMAVAVGAPDPNHPAPSPAPGSAPAAPPSTGAAPTQPQTPGQSPPAAHP